MYDLFNTGDKKSIKLYNTNDIKYKMPIPELLDHHETKEKIHIINYTNKLIEFYKMFNINIKITNYIKSLSVSRYYATFTGKTRIKSIESLTSELSIFLGTKNIKTTIDSLNNSIIFEIPNNTRQALYFTNIIKENTKKEGLQVCFGKDLNNNNYYVDLCKTPHLLISGTTGSGKSVFINNIILNLLYNYTPKELNLIMIDPKKVELSIYKNIPHLKAEIATETETAKKLLDYVIKEMYKRYELLQEQNTRNIENYNKKVNEKMPYLVIIIDELADLMLSDTKTKLGVDLIGQQRIDDKICRIAQMGRACGIHLIVATQRPSTDVITGLIKANIPSRVAFSVSNMYDSKVILDIKGAEKLTGNGDMYYKPIGNNDLVRIQSPFVSDEEVERIVNYIKEV